MLVLTQGRGEAVIITLLDGTEITVRYLGRDAENGGRARIGYEAPKSIVVDRAKIHERKKRQAGEVSGNVAEPAEVVA